MVLLMLYCPTPGFYALRILLCYPLNLLEVPIVADGDFDRTTAEQGLYWLGPGDVALLFSTDVSR